MRGLSVLCLVVLAARLLLALAQGTHAIATHGADVVDAVAARPLRSSSMSRGFMWPDRVCQTSALACAGERNGGVIVISGRFNTTHTCVSLLLLQRHHDFALPRGGGVAFFEGGIRSDPPFHCCVGRKYVASQTRSDRGGKPYYYCRLSLPS